MFTSTSEMINAMTWCKQVTRNWRHNWRTRKANG